MITNNTATRATTNALTAQRRRGTTIALWVVQIGLAAMFLMSGGAKLTAAPTMVALFDAIGWGPWFRYVTGAIETSAAVALLIPSAAAYGAMLLIPTMVGAIVTNLSLGRSVIPPLVLLLVASAVAWARRNELPAIG